MNESDQYLFRALRQEEIKAGHLLIPKGQGPFEAHPRLAIDTRLPFRLGPTVEYAVRQHQWKQKGIPTSGISTTPRFERAKFYAQGHRVVVKMNRLRLPEFNIKEYVVYEYLKDHPSDIAVPEDDEIILVYNDDAIFPQGIIDEIISV